MTESDYGSGYFTFPPMETQRLPCRFVDLNDGRVYETETWPPGLYSNGGHGWFRYKFPKNWLDNMERAIASTDPYDISKFMVVEGSI